MPMHSSVKEFLEEQTQGLAELADRLRKERVAAARRAATESAARVRELNARVLHTAQLQRRLWAILKERIPCLHLNGPEPGPQWPRKKRPQIL